MIILSCNKLKKSFGIDTLLEDISFSINEGDKIGTIGINGAGKTTLFKIISGEYEYDSGDIYTSKNCNIGYLEQNTNFYSEKTVYDEVLSVFDNLILMEQNLRDIEIEIANNNKKNDDNLKKLMDNYAKKLEQFEESNGYGYKSEVKGALRGLGFSDEDFEKPVSVLSGGEKTRVLLSKLLLQKPTLLMLDEPTNHLDSEAIEWLEGFLRQYDGTVLIISHDRYFLDQAVNKIFELNNKHLKTYHGNYSYYTKQSKIDRELEIKRYENQQRDLKKQEESIERLKAYGREKHLKRARSKEKMLDKVERVNKPEALRKKAKISFKTSSNSGNDVLIGENIGKNFDENILFENANFNIYKGEKVALIGPNGVGKSTLFKIINKEINDFEGSINVGSNVNIAYFHQEQKNLNLKNTVIDEIWDNNPKLTQTEIRTVLGAFLFEEDDVFKEISSLSGGERARVAILKLILSKSNTLLLDEPTNHLDIGSKEVLEEALLNYDGTLFTISHDRYFLNTVVDKILVLNKDGITEYLGNYSYYLEKKKQKEDLLNLASEQQEEQLSKTKTQQKEDKKRLKELREKENKVKKELKILESDIEFAEKQIAGFDKMLCLEEIYSDSEKMKEINIEKTKAEKTLEKLYETWEQLL